jgi:hypothetical protein
MLAGLFDFFSFRGVCYPHEQYNKQFFHDAKHLDGDDFNDLTEFRRQHRTLNKNKTHTPAFYETRHISLPVPTILHVSCAIWKNLTKKDSTTIASHCRNSWPAQHSPNNSRLILC